MVMTQLSLKRGVKACGDEAKKALYNKMQQLYMWKAFKPPRK
jgi:hypothetical protein